MGVMAERRAGAGGVIQWTNYLFAGIRAQVAKR